MYRGDHQFRFNGLSKEEQNKLVEKEAKEREEAKENEHPLIKIGKGFVKGYLGIPLDPNKPSL